MRQWKSTLKVWVAMRVTTEMRGVLERQHFTPAYMKGWRYVRTDVGHMYVLRTDDFVRTKIYWMHR